MSIAPVHVGVRVRTPEPGLAFRAPSAARRAADAVLDAARRRSTLPPRRAAPGALRRIIADRKPRTEGEKRALAEARRRAGDLFAELEGSGVADRIHHPIRDRPELERFSHDELAAVFRAEARGRRHPRRAAARRTLEAMAGTAWEEELWAMLEECHDMDSLPFGEDTRLKDIAALLDDAAEDAVLARLTAEYVPRIPRGIRRSVARGPNARGARAVGRVEIRSGALLVVDPCYALQRDGGSGSLADTTLGECFGGNYAWPLLSARHLNGPGADPQISAPNGADLALCVGGITPGSASVHLAPARSSTPRFAGDPFADTPKWVMVVFPGDEGGAADVPWEEYRFIGRACMDIATILLCDADRIVPDPPHSAGASETFPGGYDGFIDSLGSGEVERVGDGMCFSTGYDGEIDAFLLAGPDGRPRRLLLVC